MIWQPQNLLNTPSIHLALFLHDTEWVWQAPGCPSLDLNAQFSAVSIIGVRPCSLVHLWSPQLSPPPSPCQLWTHVRQYHLPSGAYVPTSFPPGDPAWTRLATSCPHSMECQRETWHLPGYHVAGRTLELSGEETLSTRRDNDGAWLLVNYGHSMGHRFRNKRAGDNPIIWDVWIMDFVYEAFFNTLHWELRISSSQNL